MFSFNLSYSLLVDIGNKIEKVKKKKHCHQQQATEKHWRQQAQEKNAIATTEIE